MIRDAHIHATDADAGLRLDRFLQTAYPQTTRGLIQRALECGRIRVNERPAAKGYKVRPDDRIHIEELLERNDCRVRPNDAIPLPILFLDDALLAIDKAAGIPVHPIDPAETDTLANGLVARFPETAHVGDRPLFPAFAHRLDADTSGVLLAARSQEVWQALREQFAKRRVKKTYLALVQGAVTQPARLVDTLEHAGGPSHRMRVVDPDAPKGPQRRYRAITLISPERAFRDYTLLRVQIPTGITHQIRCQLAHHGHPIAGDTLYGNGDPPPRGLSRQFLHAFEVQLTHPVTGETLQIEAPLPAELARVLDALHEAAP